MKVGKVSPVVLIFGTGRNGSSLVLRLLDGNVGLLCYPNDFNYFRSFEVKTWKRKLQKLLVKIIFRGVSQDQFLAQYFFQRWGQNEIKSIQQFSNSMSLEIELDAEKMLQNIAVRHSKNYAGAVVKLFTYILGEFEENNANQTLVIKSTEPKYIDKYLELFPEARCIHIIRDPIKSYESLKRTHHLNAKPPWHDGGDILKEMVLNRWIPHAQFCREKVSKEPEKHHLVRYEDMLTDPKKTTQEILNFLGLAYSEIAEVQTAFGGRKMPTSTVNSSQSDSGFQVRVKTPSQASIDYVPVLEQREAIAIQHLTGGFLKYFGYTEPVTNVSLLQFLTSWLSPSSFELQHWTKPLRLFLFIVKRRLWLIGSFRNRHKQQSFF